MAARRKIVSAWIARSPSLELARWAAAVDRARITPVFIEVKSDAGTPPQPAAGIMSFSVPEDADALADLLRSLPLSGARIHGFDLIATAALAARRAGLPVLLLGANSAENGAIRQLLPGQFADAKLRARGVILPLPAQDQLAAEVDAARAQPRARIRARLQNRRDAWPQLVRAPAAFPGVAENENLQALHNLGYLAQPSGDLRSVEAHSYWLTFRGPLAMAGITLFPLVEYSDCSGTLQIEWGQSGDNFATAAVPLAHLGPLGAVNFTLPPDQVASGESRELRVRVIGANRPVRILEMRKYRYLGLQVDLKPFCVLTVPPN